MGKKFHSRKPYYSSDLDYTTNAPSYYEDLARKEKLIKVLAEKIGFYDEELAKRFAEWDEQLELLPNNVKNILEKWLSDGTFEELVADIVLSIGDMKVFRSWDIKLMDKIYNEFSERYINIKEFGAMGDGKTDDSDAFIAALNRENAHVYIPDGIYLISKPIHLKNGAIIQCESDNTIIRNGKGITATFFNHEFSKSPYFASNITFINGVYDIAGLSRDLTQTNQTSMFNFAMGENITFKNIQVMNGVNGHYFQFASCKNVLVENCVFVNQYDVIGSTIHEVIQIEYLSESGYPYLHEFPSNIPITDNVTIRNCRFKNVIRSIGTHGTPTKIGEWGKNITIENIVSDTNEFNLLLTGYDTVHVRNFKSETTKGVGIRVHWCKNVYVDDVLFNNINDSVVTVNNSSNITVNNVFIENTKDIVGNVLFMQNAKDVTFSNINTLSKNIGSYRYNSYQRDCENTIFDNINIPRGSETYMNGDFGCNSYRELRDKTIFKGNKEITIFEGSLKKSNDYHYFAENIYASSKIIIYFNTGDSTKYAMNNMVIDHSQLLIDEGDSRFRALVSPYVITQEDGSLVLPFLSFNFALERINDVTRRIGIRIDDQSYEDLQIRKIVMVR